MKPRLIAFLNAHTQGISGGDVRFIEIAKRTEGFGISVVTCVSGKKLCEGEDLAAEYFVTDKRWSPRNVVLAYVLRTIGALRLNPSLAWGDVLYSTSDFLPDVLPALMYKRRSDGVKWISVVHHRYEQPWRRRGRLWANVLGFVAQRLSFWLIGRYADAVFVLQTLEGREVGEHFSRVGFPGKVVEVKNGVDYSLAQQTAMGTRAFDGCFVGGLRESKGVFDLIRIWSLVCRRKEDAKLAIVGSGTEKLTGRMKQMICDLGLGKNIEMIGFVPAKADLFGMLKACRVFVSPSYEEGWGIAVCEGMACGLPVVAWDLPVYRDCYFQGMLTASIGDIEQFADRVLELLNDSELWTRMAKEATDIASRYDWDSVAKTEYEVIRGLSTARI